jgi:hypothetical protein
LRVRLRPSVPKGKKSRSDCDSTRDPQSPIEVGGKLFGIEEIRNQKLPVSFGGNVAVKNISPKRILALVTEVDLSNSYAGIGHVDFRDDRFFSSDWLEPDQLEESAQEDGSTFRALGGPNTVYQNRVASLWALKQLDRVLRSAGKMVLRRAAERPLITTSR